MAALKSIRRVRDEQRLTTSHDLLATARGSEINWEYAASVLLGQRVGQMTFVYFVGEEDEGAVKIGQAVHPLKRLRGLQTGNSRRLTIERLIYGDVTVEHLLHAYFREHAIIGAERQPTEWFEAPARARILGVADEILARQQALGQTVSVSELCATVGETMAALGYAPEKVEGECDGSMTCDCELCVLERVYRCERGVTTIVPPWQPKRRAA